MQLVRQLQEVRRDDVTTAGGKGANLGELLRAGFPTPPGFVLLTSAYGLFIARNTMQEEIERLARQIALDDAISIERASVSIRSLFDKGTIPEEIVSAVRTAYAGMGNQAVAVRSSATAEDLPNASFAGQQETYLNIQTEDDVLLTIRRCWSSLWTPRALDYRARQGIAPGSVSLAVVVQQMVPAFASGVLFTINPVTGTRDEEVINASWGLGESIVGGQVTPDMIITDKATGRAKQIEIHDKMMLTVPAHHGTIQEEVAPNMRREAVLSTEQITQLNTLGRDIEKHFGTPQDIEWAITAQQDIFVLQSRPVTTGVTVQPRDAQGELVAPGDDTWDSETNPSPRPFDLWTRTNVGENLPFPITPLTTTNFARLFLSSIASTPQETQGTRRFYGRMYINEGAILHDLSEKYGIPASFMDKMWGSRARGNQQRRDTFRPLRLIRNLPSLLLQGLSASNRQGPKHTPQQFFDQIDQWVNACTQQDLSLLDDRALWNQGLPIWQERGAYAFSTNLRISAPSALLYTALERLVKWWTGRKDIAQDLVTGLPGIFSAEVGSTLWRMAQTLQEASLRSIVLDNNPVTALALLQNKPEAQPFIKQLEHFLQRHGHRCPNELELLNPRWAEASEQVIELVTNYLQADANVNPIETEKRQNQRRADAVASVEAKLDLIRRAIFRVVLKKAQQAIIIRDNSRFYMTKFIFPIRKLYAYMGQRWVNRGWLIHPDDIFFLTVAELEAIVVNGLTSPQELQTRVTNRRTAYEYWLKVVPPDAIGPDGKPIAEDTKDIKVLEGVPASRGRVRGRARIVQDVHEAMQLGSGDILVTQATDPGWTPVFPLVRGIVLEIGGQLSHGAIVAREYAIPAVVNVQGALRSIQDGQIITVDGSNGRVYLDS